MFGKLTHKSYKLKKIFIESKLPDELLPLQEMAHNLWWSWHNAAIELFSSIDPEQWEGSRHNPIAILDQLSFDRAQELKNDSSFMTKLHSVYADFKAYINTPPNTERPSVAYFCMEYGLHISLRLYSGGLGILAGDFLKEASDSNVQMIGMGLLYRYGYFQQSISLHGDQVNQYPPQEFTKLPMKPVRGSNGEWIKIQVDFPGRKVWAKVWELMVGRISLFLLDTDIDENSWEDRALPISYTEATMNID